MAQPAIALKNAELYLTIRPDLGARIDSLFDPVTQREWLWHPANYDPTQGRSLPVGASFDENWTGGWDEIFPNDAAGSFQGYELVDHGEFWSQNWDVVEASSQQVKMTYSCQRIPVQVEKCITLDDTQPQFTITYRLQNLSSEPIAFLFKQHAAIAIAPGDEILLPDCAIEPVDLGFSQIIGRAEKTRFPHAFDSSGNEIDVRFTPERSPQLREFYYCSDLSQGQCGLYNKTSRSALMMSFDLNNFPYVWMFQSYGGWRDVYVLVMEPCTTIPWDLEVADRNNTIARLSPHETQNRMLTVRLERNFS